MHYVRYLAQCVIDPEVSLYIILCCSVFQVVLTLLVVIWGLRLGVFLLMRYEALRIKKKTSYYILNSSPIGDFDSDVRGWNSLASKTTVCIRVIVKWSLCVQLDFLFETRLNKGSCFQTLGIGYMKFSPVHIYLGPCPFFVTGLHSFGAFVICFV